MYKSITVASRFGIALMVGFYRAKYKYHTQESQSGYFDHRELKKTTLNSKRSSLGPRTIFHRNIWLILELNDCKIL